MQDILGQLNSILDRLQSSADSGEMSLIERDMVLERIRRVYESLAGVRQTAYCAESEAVVAPEPEVVVAPEQVETSTKINRKALLSLYGDEESTVPRDLFEGEEETELRHEIRPEIRHEIQPEVRSEVQPGYEARPEAQSELDEGEVFEGEELEAEEDLGFEIVDVAAAAEERVVYEDTGAKDDQAYDDGAGDDAYDDGVNDDGVYGERAYDDRESESPSYEPEFEITKAAADDDAVETIVLGDLRGDLGRESTIADLYANVNARNGNRDMAAKLSADNITELRRAIGINDKFLLVRDLFDGDQVAYERAMDELERFDDLDDALIHIHEKYDWRPDSDGARMLIDLLTKKLG